MKEKWCPLLSIASASQNMGFTKCRESQCAFWQFCKPEGCGCEGIDKQELIDKGVIKY